MAICITFLRRNGHAKRSLSSTGMLSPGFLFPYGLRQACDGTRLGLNGRSLMRFGPNKGHDPCHGVCTECNERALAGHLLVHSSENGLGGIWKSPVKSSKTANRLKKPCTCMEGAMKLNLCGACREVHMTLDYWQRFQRGVTALGDGSSEICIGDVLPEGCENPGLRQKYQCYVCEGFIVSGTFEMAWLRNPRTVDFIF